MSGRLIIADSQLSFFKSKFHCFDAIIIIAGFIIDVCMCIWRKASLSSITFRVTTRISEIARPVLPLKPSAYSNVCTVAELLTPNSP